MAKIHLVVGTANAGRIQMVPPPLVSLDSKLPLWTQNRSFSWISYTIDNASATVVT